MQEKETFRVSSAAAVRNLSATTAPRAGYSRPFKSRRNVGGTDKFWLAAPRPRNEKIGRMMPPIAMCIGFMATILAAYWGYSEVPKHKFREIWYEDFSNGLDPASWNHEIGLGGFGAGTFDWTTDHTNNSFVADDGHLYIYPTLTTWPPQVEGSIVNLTADGTCSLTAKLDCVALYNQSTYQIVNPVQSARLTTQGKHTIRFGRVEIRAKMPRGRYIWPALWFMPEDSVYGTWPASGELDLFEGRGNNPTNLKPFYSNCMQASAHWGPDYSKDPGHYVTLNTKKQTHTSCWPRHSLTEKFHTYVMEWTPQGLLYYIDSPLYVMMQLDFKEGPWKTGIETVLDSLGSPVPNPWSASPLKAAPFDQEFYLIMNVAVGSYNGWFLDDYSDNPAYSSSGGTGGEPYEAVHNFWKSQHQWYPSWPTDLHRGMAIKWIRMSELVDSEHWENLPSARISGVGKASEDNTTSTGNTTSTS